MVGIRRVAQMFPERIQVDVMDVLFVVFSIANAVIGKPALPDFEVRLELLFRSERETALDELDCAFQSYLRSEEQMKMIGHQDEFVEEIRFASIRKESFEEETSPGFSSKERSTLPCFGRDEVGLRVVGGVLACGFQELPSGAKARIFSDLFRHG